MSNDAYTVIEGTITGFVSVPGNINLLEKIRSNNTTKNVATGVVGALGDMYGVVANSAMLTMYEGEDVENFIFKMDGKVACGSLKLNAMLKDGDYIKAVGSQNDEVFVVEAIIRPSDTLMWMFGPAFTGTKTMFYREIIPTYFAAVFSTMFAVFLYFFARKHEWPLYATVIGSPTIGMLLMNLWTYKDLKPFAIKAESVFKALKFPDPDKFDLMPGFVGRAYNYAKAIKKYEDKKAGIKTPKRKRRTRK